MENLVMFALVAFIVLALLRYLLFEPRSPQIIYVETKPPAEPEESQGNGCLSLIILWVVIAAALWVA
jgi:hypothetical protein